jgi:hypothetical protein
LECPPDQFGLYRSVPGTSFARHQNKGIARKPLGKRDIKGRDTWSNPAVIGGLTEIKLGCTKRITTSLGTEYLWIVILGCGLYGGIKRLSLVVTAKRGIDWLGRN